MMQVRKILIADDDEDLRAALAEQIALHEEFAAVHASTGEARWPRPNWSSRISFSWMSAFPTWTGRSRPASARKGLYRANHHADRA